MSGALQAVFQNQRSFIPPLPADIGAAYGGGFFAGQINQSGTVYNLVVGPLSAAQSQLAWKNIGTGIIPVSLIDGPQNTADLVADGNSTVYPAAHFCNDLVTGGFSDWYMPAKNELEVCYYFLKPTTTANDTSSGANENAVSPEPISTNYSSGSPAQTSAAAFQSGGAQAFTANNYWSSTANTGNEATAWRQHFSYGLLYRESKLNSYRVRAVRRVSA